MRLKFQPKENIAEPQSLQKISDAIEICNREQKQQALSTTMVGSQLLKRLQNAAELTQNFDTVDIEDINTEITLVLLEAYQYKENLEKDLELIENFKLSIQLANSRDWYRKFLKERSNVKTNTEQSSSGTASH